MPRLAHLSVMWTRDTLQILSSALGVLPASFTPQTRTTPAAPATTKVA